MKQVIVIVLVVVVAIFAKIGLTSNDDVSNNAKNLKTSSQATTATTKKTSSLDLSELKGLQYKFTVVPPQAIDYLKNRSEYKNSYNSNKKFVVYYSDAAANDKYVRLISTRMTRYRSQYKFKKHYDFYPHKDLHFSNPSFLDATSLAMFFGVCGVYCVVNPEKGQIFALNIDRVEAIEKFGTILTQLKDW